MNSIPTELRDLFERPIVVSLATLLPDGSPQVQPVWCSADGDHILVNTEKSRQKYRNLSKRRMATLLAVDPDDDNRWVEIRGTVVEESEQGAREHIDQLAQRYLGVETYPYHLEGDVRVVFRIEPRRVASLNSTMPQFASEPA